MVFSVDKYALITKVTTSPNVALEKVIKIESMEKYLHLMGMGIGALSSSSEL